MLLAVVDTSAARLRRLRECILVLTWLVDIDKMAVRIGNSRCRGQKPKEAQVRIQVMVAERVGSP